MQEYREVMMVKLKVEQIGKDKELPLDRRGDLCGIYSVWKNRVAYG